MEIDLSKTVVFKADGIFVNGEKMDNYRDKRKTSRRQEDGKFEFLMTQVKVAIRLLKANKEIANQLGTEVLKDAVDTIEKGEKI